MKLVCLLLTFLSSFSALSLTVNPVNQAVNAPSQFIRADGPNLKAKLDAAASQARANNQIKRYWTAYQFDVRPGIAIDAEWRNGNGVYIQDGVMRADGKTETRNLGIFILREVGAEAISRIEIYNLDRRREYSGYPVYWLGRASNEESLNFLKAIADAEPNRRLAEQAVGAIAVHDDGRVSAMLEEFVRQSKIESVRKTAVFWIGQIDGANPMLAELVRNDQEALEVRKQAAFAIGVSKSSAALATLENLYGSVKEREVKKQIIFAASINENKEGSVDFLIRTASNDPDREVKKQALFWLGQKAGERSRAALGNVIESNDADTEVQKQAVFAISQRSKDEAVPMLIKIARTHPKPEVRKQAIFWLGQTGDERALDFFKEVLAK